MKTNTKANLALLAIVACSQISYAQYEGVHFYSSDVSGFDFTGMSLDGASFYSSANVTGASFKDASVYGVNFGGATGLVEAQVKSTLDYKDNNRLYLGLSGNDMSGWDLSGVDLTGSIIVYMDTNKLVGTNLTDAVINDTRFMYFQISGLTPEQFYSTASYKAGNLTGVDLSSSQLVASDGSVAYNFANQDLTNSDFWGCYFASFDGTVKADFTNAIIKGANLGASHRHFNSGYGQGRLTAEQFYSTASYKTGDLQGVGLSDSDLAGWNFSNSDGVAKDLTGMNFESSKLLGVDFEGAIIKDANFHWDYNNNSFVGNVNEYDSNGLQKEQLYSTKSYQDKDLGAIDLGGHMQYNPGVTPLNKRRDLTDWDFNGQNLEGASFADAAISSASQSADFTGAIIKGVNFSSTFEFGESGNVSNRNGLTFTQLKSTASWASGELQKVSFGGLDLNSWDFSDSDGVVKNLTGASFSKSKLVGTDFTNAIVAEGNFSGTTFFGFTKEQFYSTATYQSGDLRKMKFQMNDLRGWDFSNKDLSGADFFYNNGISDEHTATNGSLVGADFTDAIILNAAFGASNLSNDQLYSTKSYKDKDLRGVYFDATSIKNASADGKLDLTWQNLQNANIRGSDLTDVDFTNADLRGAFTGALSSAAAAQATYKNTIWSDGVVKNVTLAADGDTLVVKNYENPEGNQYFPLQDEAVITTKISDNDVVMTGGKLVIETGAPLALVQHKSLTADGGQIVMNYGADGFGVINVYGSELGQSNFIITENTEYYIDFGVFGPDADEYLLVDATYGGNIVGNPDDIKYSVWDNGVDVTDQWEFKLVGDQLKIVLAIPEASAYAAVLGLAAMAMAACRRRR